MGRHLDLLRQRLHLRRDQELPLDRPDVREAVERDAAEAGPQGAIWSAVHNWIDAERHRDAAAREVEQLAAFLVRNEPAEAGHVLYWPRHDGGQTFQPAREWRHELTAHRRTLEALEWRLAEAHRAAERAVAPFARPRHETLGEAA